MKLRGAIEARRRQTQETLIKLQKLGPLLQRKTDAATGEEKKKLIAQQGLFDKRSAEAVHAVEQAEADLEGIDNPASGREELVKILARQRSAAKVAEEIEVSAPGLDPYKKRVNHDVTTTTTSYADGHATIDTERDKRHLGLDGWTKEQSHEKEVHGADSVARNSQEKKTQVSLAGKASVDEKQSAEVELADGRKAGTEHGTAREISAEGASRTVTDKTTSFDGSSTSTTRKQGVERGEGKVTATTSTSVTTTGASGTAHSTDRSATGGMIAGNGGIGAHGGADRGKKVTTKKGMEAGVVAGVHANVVCRIGKPSGDPKQFPVTLTVSFEASAAASGGAGKSEGSKASVGVELKGSVEKSMTVTHLLGEAQLADYTQALRDASKKGGKVAATHQEFAIISAGVNQGWDAARQMWQSGGKAFSKKTADSLGHSGDSIAVAEKRTGGVGVNAKVGGLGLGAGVSESDEDSKKMTRNDTGALDIDTRSEHTREGTKSASLSAGVAGLDIGTVQTHKTSFGYSISIDPKNDPDGKILEALGACKSELQYEIFIATHPGKITVTGKTRGKADADSTEAGLSLGGHKIMSMGTSQGVNEESKTDAHGKLIKKTVAGHAGAGGKLLGAADSVDEDAVAEIDGDGNASLTMTRTKNDNHGDRAVAKRLKKITEKFEGSGEGGAKPGALTSLAGGEEDDSVTHDKSGLGLSNDDLRRLGGIACRSLPAWMGATRRADEKKDWLKAGKAIAQAKGRASVVAEELARFLGGDRVERMAMVEKWVRGGYQSTIGHAFEFPDGLSDLQDDYERVLAEAIPGQLDALAEKSPDKAIAECKRLMAIVDKLDAKIRGNDEFDNGATKMEMLERLVRRRKLLAGGVEGYAGTHKRSDPKALEEECDRLTKQCTSFFVEQMKVRRKLADMLGKATEFDTGDLGSARKLIRQVEDLQLRWWEAWREMKGTFDKRGIKMPEIPTLMPDASIVAFYDKAARQ